MHAQYMMLADVPMPALSTLLYCSMLKRVSVCASIVQLNSQIPRFVINNCICIISMLLTAQCIHFYLHTFPPGTQ